MAVKPQPLVGQAFLEGRLDRYRDFLKQTTNAELLDASEDFCFEILALPGADGVEEVREMAYRRSLEGLDQFAFGIIEAGLGACETGACETVARLALT
jgi:hypothetical protein